METLDIEQPPSTNTRAASIALADTIEDLGFREVYLKSLYGHLARLTTPQILQVDT